MDTEAVFEKWWEDIGCFANCSKKEAIIIWQASRAAIEIETPERARLESHGKYKGRYLCGDCSFDAEYALGINHTIDWFEEAITSHGIRIKGKTE